MNVIFMVTSYLHSPQFASLAKINFLPGNQVGRQERAEMKKGFAIGVPVQGSPGDTPVSIESTSGFKTFVGKFFYRHPPGMEKPLSIPERRGQPPGIID
jgi:hypothetical protein